MTLTPAEALPVLKALAGRLRPGPGEGLDGARWRLRAETQRLEASPAEAALVGEALRAVLALPRQGALYAEAGVRSALGNWLELSRRFRLRVLPPALDPARLDSLLGHVFPRPRDHVWVASLPDEAWLELARALGPLGPAPLGELLEAVRLISYRLAGAALDRELLGAAPDLEGRASPFLAQNALLLPVLERAAGGGPGPTPAEAAPVRAQLEACGRALAAVRAGALEKGISLRLTYQLARLDQLLERQRLLLDALAAEDGEEGARRWVLLLKTLVAGEQSRHRILAFLREDIQLLALNITDHASRHGEHYIAETRREWLGMGLAAAGGGVVIAFMAFAKARLALLHLPPLTEGLAFGLNYALGFVLIHLLGFSVATKQPAMTASSIAATLEGAHPHDLHRLVDLAQNVVRTQFIAVVGNVGLALPVAFLLALGWARFLGAPIVPEAKALGMLRDVDPLASGALFYAALAGLGLFLSGLVSGYFDNRTQYHGLADRLAVTPALAWLGADRAARLGLYADAHVGAILGNLFFGLYLGLVGALNTLTGLPLDIRHVAFSSANLGTSLVVLGPAALRELLPWAVAGVAAIALVNLAVSFSLALFVALQSRAMSAGPLLALGAELGRRFLRRPLGFFLPPPA